MKPASFATIVIRLAALWVVWETVSSSGVPLILRGFIAVRDAADAPVFEGFIPYFVILPAIGLFFAALLYVLSKPLGQFLARGLE